MGGVNIGLRYAGRYLRGLPTGVFPGGYELSYPKSTVALIIINVAVYAVTSIRNMFMSISDYWVELGSYIPILMVEDSSNIYRVFTSMFLHGDILHIFFNMYFLYIFGKSVENSLGSLRFLVLYFISGILATVFHTAFSYIQGAYALMIPAIGASGAISGVLAAYLMFYPGTSLSACWFFFIFPVCFTVRASYWLLFWFATQVIYGYSRLGAAVAFFAHAGGFVAGIALLPLVVRRERLELLRAWRSYGHILNVIFRDTEFVRGLGRLTKVALSILIASLIAGSAVITSNVNYLSIYVADVSGRAANITELDDSVMFALVNDNVEVQTITNTYTRVLINRLVGLDVLINRSASSSSLNIVGLNTTSKLRVGNTIVDVPVYVESLRLTYGVDGVLKEAYGSFRTVIVSIGTNTYRFGESITYDFNIKVVEHYDASRMILSTGLVSLTVSAIALMVTLFRDKELTIVG
ncbi:MAG: rhomboid family intramembrane serine protease [Sulfolobales archaeon]|nr:rhomboid family intramembrane serine protease [Sulfolobales archaeon]